MNYKNIVIVGLMSILFSACSSDSTTTTAASVGSVTVKFTVVNMPSTLEFNKATTGDSKVEYQWGVILDIDNSSNVSAGDIKFDLKHFKSPGAAPTTQSPTYAVARMWEYTNGSSHTAVSGATVNASVSGNVVTLTVSKATHDSLKNLTTIPKVYFQTIGIDNGDVQQYDHHPAANTMVAVPADGKLTDPTGDYQDINGNATTPASVVSFADLTAMEITIN